MKALDSRHGLWAVGLLAILPLLGWWAYGLFDLDEGFYAAVTGEMIRRGEWVTPFYNGQPWFEKPILLYWVARPMVQIFGEMVGPRLSSILPAIGLYVAVFTFSRRWLGTASATAASLVLATSLLMVALSRMMMTDLLLVLFLSLALLLVYRSTREGHSQLRTWAGVSLGLAVLAKGPVALILFGGILGAYYVLESSARNGLRGQWWLFTGLLIATIATWYVPCYLANRDTFVQKFLIEQNLQRFQGGDLAHKLAFGQRLVHYPLIVFLGLFPWIFHLRRAVGRALVARGEEGPLLRFCLVWASAVFGFFYLSGSQLPHYILPMWPPMAILLGHAVAQRIAAIQGAGTQAEMVDASTPDVRTLILGQLKARFAAGETAAPREDLGVTLRLLRPFAIASVAMCAVANIAFLSYYNGGLGAPTSHAEVHAAARFCRGKEVVWFNEARGTKDLGTGGTKIMQTSHPSFLFYSRGLATVMMDESEFKDLSPGTMIFTRPGRLDPAKSPLALRRRDDWRTGTQAKPTVELWEVQNPRD